MERPSLKHQMLKRFISSDFNRNSLVLLSGTVISQALPLIFAPILARLYSPSDFGAFSLFFSIAVVLGTVSSAKLDLALYTSLGRENALITAMSGIVFSLLFSLLIGIICWISYFIWELKSLPISVLLLIPFTVFLIGCSQSLMAFSNREKKFSAISKAKVILGLVWVSVNVGLGFTNLGVFGLALGYSMGQLFSVLKLAYSNRKAFFLVRFNVAIFKRNLLRNRSFAFIFLPAHLINTVASNGPSFLLSSMFGLEANGYYFKAARVGESPTGVIRNSLGNVFWQQASHGYITNGSARKEMISFLGKLLLIGIVPYVLAYLYAEEIFFLLFGAKWANAATYFTILAPYFFIQFIIAPVTIMVVLANKPWVDITWQIFFGLSVLSSFYIGWYYHDVYLTLRLYTIFMIIMQLVALGINFHFSIKKQ